jgi:CheY-like chemotaxis protein
MKTILIVDDERTNRIRLAQIARSLGFSAILASDGIKALSVLEDNPDIDCVVTDCQMPNLDGPGLISRIRPGNSGLLILVYSAYRSIDEIASLLDQGANGFLNYPVTRENLGEYLNRYLSKDWTTNQQTPGNQPL